jgi:hypothetical protein
VAWVTEDAVIALLASFAFLGLCKLVAVCIRAAAELLELP